jgi:hypothetical protein
MVVMTSTRSVSTRLRIERRFDGFDVAAEALDHVLNHMIGPDANAVTQQLHRQMAITEMPRDSHEFAIVMGVNFKQRLRACTDPNDRAVLQQQPIAVAQAQRLGEVDQQVMPGLRCQNDPAAVTAIEVDQDLIDRIRPGTRRQDGRRAHQ